jgi:hypothetical protein
MLSAHDCAHNGAGGLPRRVPTAPGSVYRAGAQDAGSEALAWGVPVRILVVLVKDLAGSLEA